MLILAFVDGSLYSKSVVDHAAWVAGRTGASVKVLHVLGRRETSSIPINISGSIGADARDTLLA
ncbi:MAG: universal stress protein, partial [Bauldia sp.]